jgi:hypothetical protein
LALTLGRVIVPVTRVCCSPTGRLGVKSGRAIQSAEGREDTRPYDRACPPTVADHDSADRDAQHRPHDSPHQELRKVTLDGSHRCVHPVWSPAARFCNWPPSAPGEPPEKASSRPPSGTMRPCSGSTRSRWGWKTRRTEAGAREHRPAPIHRSAWKGDSANFAPRGFYELHTAPDRGCARSRQSSSLCTPRGVYRTFNMGFPRL